MKNWIIPVSWEVCSTIEVEANTLEEAIKIATDEDGEIPCPTDTDYVDASWRVDDAEDIDFLRECYNNNQKDEEGEK
jgi:hypothetical protein